MLYFFCFVHHHIPLKTSCDRSHAKFDEVFFNLLLHLSHLHAQIIVTTNDNYIIREWTERASPLSRPVHFLLCDGKNDTTTNSNAPEKNCSFFQKRFKLLCFCEFSVLNERKL